MQSLKQAIKTTLRKTGLNKGVEQYTALNIWSDVVGKSVSDNTTPERVDHGIMIVKSKSPAWRHELMFQKNEILRKLNEQLGKQTIKDIKFL